MGVVAVAALSDCRSFLPLLEFSQIYTSSNCIVNLCGSVCLFCRLPVVFKVLGGSMLSARLHSGGGLDGTLDVGTVMGFLKQAR